MRLQDIISNFSFWMIAFVLFVGALLVLDRRQRDAWREYAFNLANFSSYDQRLFRERIRTPPDNRLVQGLHTRGARLEHQARLLAIQCKDASPDIDVVFLEQCSLVLEPFLFSLSKKDHSRRLHKRKVDKLFQKAITLSFNAKLHDKQRMRIGDWVRDGRLWASSTYHLLPELKGQIADEKKIA